MAEEVAEGNANTEHDKPENNSRDLHEPAFQQADAGASVPTVAAHLVQLSVKLVQFVVQYRLSGLIKWHQYLHRF